MIRNLKALGLAFAAVFAFGAVAAATASAQIVKSDGPVTLDTSETGIEANALESFGSRVECPGSVTTGHKVITHEETTAGGEHQSLPSEFTTATITPHWEEPCHVTGSRQATVTMNGCDFVFHVEGVKAEGEYNVVADLVCPPEQRVVLHVNSNTPPEAPGSNLCTVNIAPQSGLEGATIKETAEGHLGVEGTFTNIHVTREGLCLFDGKGSTTNNGTFDIDVTVEGTNAEGAPTDLSLSEA